MRTLQSNGVLIPSTPVHDATCIKYKVIRILGNNIVTVEGDVWKRHRRIVGPAFNQSTYENVWNSTAQVYKDMVFYEGWRDLQSGMPTPVIDINAITHKVGFCLPGH